MDISECMNCLSGRLDGMKETSAGYQFRCPYCGDSRKKTAKARGYVYQYGLDWFFKCHNCGISKSFCGFLQDMDAEAHKKYLRDSCQYSQGSVEGALEPLKSVDGITPSSVTQLPRGSVDAHEMWKRARKWTPAHLHRGERKRF